MSFNIQLNQRQLCSEFQVKIRNELTTKYAALKITFPEERFQALNALELEGSYTTKGFQLYDDDLEKLSKVGITKEKISRVAALANYYTERHYLDIQKISEHEKGLKELSDEGLEFTVLASTNDQDQAKNLAFNHSWQRQSRSLKY